MEAITLGEVLLDFLSESHENNSTAMEKAVDCQIRSQLVDEIIHGF